MIDLHRIKKILENPVNKIAEVFPKVSIYDISIFINDLYCFLTSEQYKNIINKEPFILILKEHINDSIQNISFKELNTFLTKYNSFTLNFKNEFEKTEQISVDDFNILDDYSEQEPSSIFIYIDYYCVEFIHKGYIIKRYSNIHDIKKEARGKNKQALPISDYRLLAENHFREHVLNEKKLAYWDNKSNRILKKSPENIFHKSLYSYLDINLANGRVDSELSNKGGSDRLDIQLIDFDTEKVYILEIKWMGKSSTGTSYSKKQMEQAFDQLNIYLNNNPEAAKGAIVIYDASNKDEEIVCYVQDYNSKLDIKAIKFFLSSVSASVKAKQVVSK